MVLTHTTNHTYSHPFPTVTLAFFLRYLSPQLNPFASHVLSTDTLSSHIDPGTGRLHTIRIHLKKSRLPGGIMKLLPTSVTGGVKEKASYILETSVVDMKEGWMRTESQNLNFTGILSVVERQLYSAPPTPLPQSVSQAPTDVETTVVFRSRLGERIRERIGQGQTQQEQSQEEARPRFGKGWVAGLGKRGIQRSIETIGATKTLDQLGKSREGMRVVLERLRKTGVLGVMELRKRAMEGNLETA